MPIWHQSPKLTPRYFLETPRLFGYPSKAAKTACASKLVRIIYSMCKTGELYQYNK